MESVHFILEPGPLIGREIRPVLPVRDQSRGVGRQSPKLLEMKLGAAGGRQAHSRKSWTARILRFVGYAGGVDVVAPGRDLGHADR
jgi:hypothetical protein